ncbi:MAG: lysophospholipid acyltransferase family protein [Acidobacteria bacterium]|nr:lysophospholipid acyltransferase family protein [Acidobacteriota bacterium]
MTNPHSLGAAAALHALMADHIPVPLAGPASRLLGLDRFVQLYDELRVVPNEQPIACKLLDHLQVQAVFSEEDRAKIPQDGPVVVVANHPFGLLDAAVLAALLPERRPDVKLLGNRVLQAFPELRDQLIVVDPDDDARGAALSVAGLRQALALLKSGGMLAAFPAGEVSHFHLRSRRVEDRAWSPSIGGLIRRSGATAVPIYIEGSNSALFQLAGLLHPKLRTAMLPRELLNKRRHEVLIRVGAPIPASGLAQLATDVERADYLRWRTHLLQYRQQFKARTAKPFIRTSTKLRRAPVMAEALLIDGDLACYAAPA